MSDIERDIQTDLQVMQERILPMMKRIGWINPETVVTPCEGSDDERLKTLDLKHCIDYLFQEPNKTEYGIGFRRQNGRNYATTTIRLERANGFETEYTKLKKHIESGDPYPKYIIQAYMSKDNSKILNMAIIKTKDLIFFTEGDPGFKDYFYYDTYNGHDAMMRVFQWKTLLRHRHACDIRILYEDKIHHKIYKILKPKTFGSNLRESEQVVTKRPEEQGGYKID